MVEVPVAEHAPSPPAHGAEQRVLRPGTARAARRELLNQSLDPREVCLPSRRLGPEALGWPFDPRLGPRQPVERELANDWPAERARHGSAGALPQGEAHLVTKVREHLRGRHPTPLRRSVRGEPAEPAEQLLPAVPNKHGAHRSLPLPMVIWHHPVRGPQAGTQKCNPIRFKSTMNRSGNGRCGGRFRRTPCDRHSRLVFLRTT
jgi:hypothetical protein